MAIKCTSNYKYFSNELVTATHGKKCGYLWNSSKDISNETSQQFGISKLVLTDMFQICFS